MAATSLSGVDKDEADADAETAHAARRGRGGAPLGRAVHAVLQTIDLETGAGIEDTARAQAAAEGIPQLQSEIAELARAAVSSGIVRRAVASGRYWRESPVAAPIGDGEDGGGVLEGFIDLLFEEDGELVVVDYKTDAIDAGRGRVYCQQPLPLAGGQLRAHHGNRHAEARQGCGLPVPAPQSRRANAGTWTR